jgi:hypothetical protein
MIGAPGLGTLPTWICSEEHIRVQPEKGAGFGSS